MKTVVLCLLVIVILAAGCNKTTISSRDAFVGNYHMHDSVITSQTNFANVVIYDTVSRYYNLQVVAVSGTSDKVSFNNQAGFGVSDIGTVSGSLVTFTNNSGTNISDATLSGNTLTQTISTFAGTKVYASSTGTKF